MQTSGARVVALLAAFTVLLPVLCVYLGDPLFWSLTERPERALEDTGTAFVQACLTGAAFLAVTLFAAFKQARGELDARTGRAVKLAAVVGSAITVALWALYYYDGYAYWRDGGTGGANIGLGVVMLVMPILAGLPMAVAYAWSLRGALER